MIETLVNIFLYGLLLYVALGLVFSVFFYWKGARIIDEGTAGTPWHFKLIIFPGVILFWMVLFIKYLKRS